MTTSTYTTQEGNEIVIKKFQTDGNFELEISHDIERKGHYNIMTTVKRDGRYLGTVVATANKNSIESVLISAHFLKEIMVNGSTAQGFWDRIKSGRFIKKMIKSVAVNEYDVVDFMECMLFLYAAPQCFSEVIDAFKTMMVKIDLIVLAYQE